MMPRGPQGQQPTADAVGCAMSTDPKSPIPNPILEEREITLPSRDYQPTKAETEREYDMPGADIVTVRSAFFRRVKVREKPPETD